MRFFPLAFVSITLVLIGVANVTAGPLCNLLHRVTHPLEKHRERREARQQPAPQAAQPFRGIVDPEAGKRRPWEAAPKSVTVPTVYVRTGGKPPAAPPGMVWERFACNAQGCYYRSVPASTRGSATCDGCDCGCSQGGPCACNATK